MSDVPSQGGYNNNSGEWIVGDLTSGNSVMLEITVMLNDEAPVESGITYTASLAHSDQVDPDSSNNSSNISFTVSFIKADLAVSMDVSNATPNKINITLNTIALNIPHFKT